MENLAITTITLWASKNECLWYVICNLYSYIQYHTKENLLVRTVNVLLRNQCTVHFYARKRTCKKGYENFSHPLELRSCILTSEHWPSKGRKSVWKKGSLVSTAKLFIRFIQKNRKKRLEKQKVAAFHSPCWPFHLDLNFWCRWLQERNPESVLM